MSSRLLQMFVLTSFVFVPMAFAQDENAPPPVRFHKEAYKEQHLNASDEQKATMDAHREDWQSMSPEERKNIIEDRDQDHQALIEQRKQYWQEKQDAQKEHVQEMMDDRKDRHKQKMEQHQQMMEDHQEMRDEWIEKRDTIKEKYKDDAEARKEMRQEWEARKAKHEEMEKRKNWEEHKSEIKDLREKREERSEAWKDRYEEHSKDMKDKKNDLRIEPVKDPADAFTNNDAPLEYKKREKQDRERIRNKEAKDKRG